ncbi:hypothetical protein Patl1_30328 [Pistacia atlantica]|uniref:Uncharacterized protein n=1 Tax=Pistacia atlantica TaxID=434234 RepID=A0ACC1AE09_9ROSI|nr:hypothetical protein Patl1_30328 [Pistacia atlantica]
MLWGGVEVGGRWALAFFGFVPNPGHVSRLTVFYRKILKQILYLISFVTKKSDLSDFYFNLGKNVAFGAEDVKSRKVNRQAEVRNLEPEKDHSPTHSNSKQQDIRAAEPSRIKEGHQAETSVPPKSLESLASKPVSDVPISVQDDSSNEQPSADEPKRDHHKRSEDALAAAKERFLARKRMKEQ